MRFQWFLHNVVGHPLMGLAALFGFKRLADWFHNVTLPRELR